MMSQNGAPILVLNTNTKRRFGHKVQIENIAAGDNQIFLFFNFNFCCVPPNLPAITYIPHGTKCMYYIPKNYHNDKLMHVNG